MDCWHILGIAPTRDEAAIKRAYAQLLKKHRPDRDPDGFIRLREAYEMALAGGEQYNTFADDTAGEPPELLDARALRRSWRQAKSDDALLALLQEQSAALPTIDEQLDFRDLIASWIEGRDRPQRYPQSLIWAIEKYHLLRGLPDDDPLWDDYLHALIHTGARDKALRVIARRAPELGAWLALSGWQQRRYGLRNAFVTDPGHLIDLQLARLQTTLRLDNAAITARFPAAARLAPDSYCMDGTIPRRKIGEMLDFTDGLSKKYRLQCINVFHAGDGNMHPLILFDSCIPGEWDRAEKFGAEILELCVGLGGTITGEHGVGLEKLDGMCAQFGEGERAAFWGIKAAFDPEMLLNRDKKLPLKTRCAEYARTFDGGSIAAKFPDLEYF